MERQVVVTHPEGLHARPAAEVAKAAARFRSRIDIAVGDRVANARSILSILKLGVARGQTVLLSAEGEDASEALEGLSALMKADIPVG
jgi:phosphotransferase system HPr (HPr) family protein